MEVLKTLVPEIDPEDPRARTWLRRLSNRDVALLLIQLVSVVVFAFNFSVTVWTMAKMDGYRSNFVDILGPGNGGTCATVRAYNRWLHLVINALSTVLLGASNYCAQLLAAPTREEVDEAHADGRWFDVGVQSFRNLRRVDSRRRYFWVCLMLSSGLLHLL